MQKKIRHSNKNSGFYVLMEIKIKKIYTIIHLIESVALPVSLSYANTYAS